MTTWDRQATAKMTGIPASIGAQLLEHDAVQRTGALAPEVAFDPAQFIRELGKRGIYVGERIEEHGMIGGAASVSTSSAIPTA
jgi:saccharopine dehydrogenase-like NADP-dependent oxidoreductase